MRHTALLTACLLVAIAFISLRAAIADRADPEMVPPDVTIPETTSTAPYSVQQRSGIFQPGSRSTSPQPGITKEEPQKDPMAIVTTDKGIISIRLFRKYAPRTVANFVELSEKGFYNG